MPIGGQYRLYPQAIRDLDEIWFYSAKTWSIEQANTYVDELEQAFDRIALNPRISRLRNEFSPPVRVYRFKAHVIIDREHGDDVLIIRIRHGREDWTGNVDAE